MLVIMFKYKLSSLSRVAHNSNKAQRVDSKRGIIKKEVEEQNREKKLASFVGSLGRGRGQKIEFYLRTTVSHSCN